MKKSSSPESSHRPTKVEKLHGVLADKEWHSTRELARSVGHTFAVAKFVLTHVNGYQIEKRRHGGRRHEFEYRLAD